MNFKVFVSLSLLFIIIDQAHIISSQDIRKDVQNEQGISEQGDSTFDERPEYHPFDYSHRGFNKVFLNLFQFYLLDKRPTAAPWSSLLNWIYDKSTAKPPSFTNNLGPKQLDYPPLPSIYKINKIPCMLKFLDTISS